MEATRLDEIQYGNFGKAIKICDEQIKKLKSPDKQKKYKDAKAAFGAAEAKLKDLIAKTKEIKMSSGNTFHEDFLKDKESFVTFAWLSEKISAEHDNIEDASKAKAEALDLEVPDVDPRWDCIDATKKFAKDMGNEKSGLSRFLSKTFIAVGLGDILTRGVTKTLVKEGIMKESLGLVGLGKLGIANLPNLWSAICLGASKFWAFSPLGVVAAGGFLAVKAIPMINKLGNKIKQNFNNKHHYENAMAQMLEGQNPAALTV